MQVEYAVGDGEARTFDYSDSGEAGRLQAPPLQYVAPELISTPGAPQQPQSPASDMFSLGAPPPPPFPSLPPLDPPPPGPPPFPSPALALGCQLPSHSISDGGVAFELRDTWHARLRLPP